MSLKIIISGYYPRDYCYQCMFNQVDNYGESSCMLHDMDTIPHPDYERPDWCPFNNAEEI